MEVEGLSATCCRQLRKGMGMRLAALALQRLTQRKALALRCGRLLRRGGKSWATFLSRQGL